MEDRETARMRKYGESKTTRIMMATVPHVTIGSRLKKISGRWIFVRQSVPSMYTTPPNRIPYNFLTYCFTLVDILLFKPWILKKIWFLTVLWFPHIIVVFVLLFSSPWKRPRVAESGRWLLCHKIIFINPSAFVDSFIEIVYIWLMHRTWSA
jgi:hypothetical protein